MMEPEADGPEVTDAGVEIFQGLLRGGRHVPIRIQHSLLTGVTSGSL